MRNLGLAKKKKLESLIFFHMNLLLKLLELCDLMKASNRRTYSCLNADFDLADYTKMVHKQYASGGNMLES